MVTYMAGRYGWWGGVMHRGAHRHGDIGRCTVQDNYGGHRGANMGVMARVSRWVARSVLTYIILVTLLTFHCPMSRLKPRAPPNMFLYADTQQRHEGRADTPSGHGTRAVVG